MTKILLNEDLRKKVEKRVKECFALATKKYEHKFDTMPEIRHNLKSRTAGMAYHAQWMLRFNLILLVENEKEFMDVIIPHEVAHLVNRTVNKVPEGRKRLSAHGKEWKAVMTDCYDLPPDVTHSLDCTSIEKFPRKSGKKVPKYLQLVKAFNKLSEEDKDAFLQEFGYFQAFA